MSYVWSSGVSVTISSPPPPEVASVTITPERTEGVAPVTLEFKVTAVLNREVYDWEKVDVEIVLAVNSKDNIVARKTVTISPGYKAKSAYLTYTFSKPGTYTVWGGARTISAGVAGAAYTYSAPVEIMAHPAPTPELKNLAITGAIAAIIVIAASAIGRRK
ncbi:MAG: hypothetical protein NDF55_10490 [archaeon GB-1867-005]|nr:hypothetical protein [Candidatus Culexmicrobium cathedralense]